MLSTLPGSCYNCDMKLERTLLASAMASLALFPFASSAIRKKLTTMIIYRCDGSALDKTKRFMKAVLLSSKTTKSLRLVMLHWSNTKLKQILDVDGDIVMPFGSHQYSLHVSMTVFRSLADDVPDRLHRYIFPLEKKLVSRDMVRIGTAFST